MHIIASALQYSTSKKCCRSRVLVLQFPVLSAVTPALIDFVSCVMYIDYFQATHQISPRSATPFWHATISDSVRRPNRRVDHQLRFIDQPRRPVETSLFHAHFHAIAYSIRCTRLVLCNVVDKGLNHLLTRFATSSRRSQPGTRSPGIC